MPEREGEAGAEGAGTGARAGSPGAARESSLPPDRERDAGFRGDSLARASWLLGLVFFIGLAVVVGVLVSRNKDAVRP